MQEDPQWTYVHSLILEEQDNPEIQGHQRRVFQKQDFGPENSSSTVIKNYSPPRSAYSDWWQQTETSLIG